MRDVILVPGLGKNHNERIFLWLRPLWGLYGLRLRIFEVNWEDGEAFAPKLQRLEAAVSNSQNLIGVVGASAGASAAVNLLSKGETKRIVTVCGLLEVDYLNKGSMQKRSPAFLTALTAVTEILNQNPGLASKMLTLRPLADGVVRPDVATTKGAQDIVVRSRGHAVSIAYILTFKIGAIKKFLLSA